MTMKTIAIVVPADLKARLQAVGASTCLGMTSVARTAIERYLDLIEQDVVQVRKPGTILNRVRDVLWKHVHVDNTDPGQPRAVVHQSLTQIAKQADCSVPSVRTALERLEAAGEIERGEKGWHGVRPVFLLNNGFRPEVKNGFGKANYLDVRYGDPIRG
jgi:hypothetical protein